MNQPYTVANILDARIECLMTFGYSREEAAQIVAETARPPRA